MGRVKPLRGDKSNAFPAALVERLLMGIQRSASGIPRKPMMTASTVGEKDAFGIDEANVTVSQKVDDGMVMTLPLAICPALR